VTDHSHNREIFRISNADPAGDQPELNLVSLSHQPAAAGAPAMQRASTEFEQRFPDPHEREEAHRSHFAPFNWVSSIWHDFTSWFAGHPKQAAPTYWVGEPTGRVYASKDVNPQTIQTVTNALYNMPDPILRAIMLKQTQIDIYGKTSDDPNGSLGAAAYYDDEKNRIVIYGDSGMVGEGAVHEFAHAWDGKDFQIESQPGYQQAFKADLADIRAGRNADLFAQIEKSGVLNDQPVIDGVKSGDVFAEIVAGLYGQNQSKLPYKIEQAFPRTTNYVYNQLVQSYQPDNNNNFSA
jgi:hypothetical protein